jgi:hypothetical protein
LMRTRSVDSWPTFPTVLHFEPWMLGSATGEEIRERQRHEDGQPEETGEGK